MAIWQIGEGVERFEYEEGDEEVQRADGDGDLFVGEAAAADANAEEAS